MARIKRSGLRGCPCCVALDSANGLEHKLLVITEALGEAYNRRIHDISLGPNTNFSNNEKQVGPFNSVERLHPGRPLPWGSPRMQRSERYRAACVCW